MKTESLKLQETIAKAEHDAGFLLADLKEAVATAANENPLGSLYLEALLVEAHNLRDQIHRARQMIEG